MFPISVAMWQAPSSGVPVWTLDNTLQNNTTGTSTVYTMAGSVSIGDRIFVFGSHGNSGISSVADSKGNVYSVDNNAIGGNPGTGVCIAKAPCTVPLVPGDTITVTWSTSKTGSALAVGKVSGLAASSLDLTAATNGASGTATATTGVINQASEIVFGFVCINNGGAISEASGYTRIASFSYAGGNKLLNCAYKVVGSTGAQTYSVSAGGANWNLGIATYKAA